MAHRVHVSFPGVALKVPVGHGSHTRSLLTVAAVLVYKPGPHGALTGWHAAPLSSSEYDVPTVHSAHWRSAVAEPGADWPCPAGHVAHAVHVSFPGVALNVLFTHAEHTRLDMAVGAAISVSPAAHVLISWHTLSNASVAAVAINCVPLHVVTFTHAAPLSSSEYEAPAVHAAHWRSASAEPATSWPWPTGHVAHRVHASFPDVSLKVPVGHGSHTRSLLTVAAVLVYKPGPHGALTGWHAAPLSSFEYVVPATQAAHCRSAVAEPGADWPWPAGHVVHTLHASLPCVALKVLAGHGEHTRLDVSVKAVVSNSPAEHVVRSWHTKFDVSVAAVTVNWCASHALVEPHPRSTLAVGALTWYCVSLHVVTFTHTAPLSSFEYVVPATQAAH